MIAKIKSFANDVVSEMKKVSWPSKEQLKDSTIVVIITSIILTSFIWVIDEIMTLVISALF